MERYHHLTGRNYTKKTNETHGQFAFTTSETGTYFACLSSHHDQSHYTVNGTAIVSLDWKMGIRTKDWDALELRKSEECVNEISANIIYLRVREAYMREVNDKTNKRVAQFSFMSLGLSITVSLFQVWHLKRFFLKKKLI
ncbi:hypothetical protein HID58_053654 [Brassica napus]|uniref:GOLD domain-containing protein n=1 Tax=Brassica napus TaxID=3708 RepID=A0ABQ8AFA2_BRANA|nr:hypothetical protein HID58_053654 [Brassica napus]